MRQLLCHDDAVQLRKGKLVLNPRVVWPDAAAFESALLAAQEEREKGQPDRELRLREDALALFRGQLLPSEGDKPWAAARRGRLARKFAQSVAMSAEIYRKQSNWQRAVNCYLSGLDVSPTAGSSTRGSWSAT